MIYSMINLEGQLRRLEWVPTVRKEGDNHAWIESGEYSCGDVSQLAQS
jgi:hypothetical protein